jgi:hypothetical protein
MVAMKSDGNIRLKLSYLIGILGWIVPLGRHKGITTTTSALAAELWLVEEIREFETRNNIDEAVDVMTAAIILSLLCDRDFDHYIDIIRGDLFVILRRSEHDTKDALCRWYLRQAKRGRRPLPLHILIEFFNEHLNN